MTKYTTAAESGGGVNSEFDVTTILRDVSARPPKPVHITFRTDFPGVVAPKDFMPPAASEMTIVLQHEFWNLDVKDEAFDVTLKFNNRKRRLHIPYESMLLLDDGSTTYVQASPIANIANEVTSDTAEEPVDPLAGGKRPFFLALLASGLVWIAAFAVIYAVTPPQKGTTLWDVVFFSYLPPEIVKSAAAGYVPFSTFVRAPIFCGALLLLIGSIYLASALSLRLPMQMRRPFSLQISMSGFLWGMVVTLFLFRQFHLNHELMFVVLRVFWLTLIYWIFERLKASYSETWIGAEYFPSLADGLFAITSAWIVQTELNKSYSEVTSGPIFLIVSFAVIIFVGRSQRRRFLKRVLFYDEIDIPEDTERTFRKAAPVVAGAFISRVKRLNEMTTEQMEARYLELKAELGKAARSEFPDLGTEFTIAITTLIVVWPLVMLLAMWAALNFNLHYFG